MNRCGRQSPTPRAWRISAANTNADWVAVQLGEDFHAAVLKEEQGWRYRFDVPVEGSEEREATRRVMLFSDRNVYRPGEEVHLEALVRDWGEEGLRVPDEPDRQTGLRGRARTPVLPD